jgi:SAM-dependent methyltransferase
MGAYTDAAKSGLYAKKTGLVGKYDNVRRYWEDEITRRFLRPYLIRLLERCQSQMRRLRILDLGCGSADGFELLSGIRHRGPDLKEVEVNVLSEETMGIYRGIDLNKELIDQARTIYGDNPKMSFEVADLNEGIPIGENEKPYDLYFTSYGTCSHFNEDESLIRLLSEIVKRTKDYCIIVCDWLGRYSYEWQNLWTNDLSENRNMDYIVSYIFEEEEHDKYKDKLQKLFLRLMSKIEAESIISRASDNTGVEIKPLVYFDRSIFTGRHMDTKEYNKDAQPIRQAINSLHETNIRTDLNSLLLNYVPKQGFEFLNDYFEYFQVCWNTLIKYVANLFDTYDDAKGDFLEEPPSIPATYPPTLHSMMTGMKRVVEGVGWLHEGLPRENIIEPQLGYALRTITMELQQGQGYAHSLIGVFEVDKK